MGLVKCSLVPGGGNFEDILIRSLQTFSHMLGFLTKNITHHTFRELLSTLPIYWSKLNFGLPVPRPSPPLRFDCFHANMEGEGLGDHVTCSDRQVDQVDRKSDTNGGGAQPCVDQSPLSIKQTVWCCFVNNLASCALTDLSCLFSTVRKPQQTHYYYYYSKNNIDKDHYVSILDYQLLRNGSTIQACIGG